MDNTVGTLFKITSWGESHGRCVGVVIDGCPAGLLLDEKDIQSDLDRRRPGQSPLTSSRQETDRVQILSGVFEGHTLGTPISLLVENQDVRVKDYTAIKDLFRPSHADYTYQARFGRRDWRGGGRASARETVGRVAAGAVARKLLQGALGLEVLAWVSQVGDEQMSPSTHEITREGIEASPVRCPDLESSERMAALIHRVRAEGDTVGGIVSAMARGVPPGLGAPVFDKLEADLAHAVMSLPACRGFEVGSGFSAAQMRGSEHNDAFFSEGTRIRTRTNHSGGIQGGISNGENIILRAVFKPVATLFQDQETVTSSGNSTTVHSRGRHDPCVLPRATPLVEAMVLLVLADHYLRAETARIS